jgi:hypothetical protein
LICIIPAGFAELPPDAYKQKQQQAAESLIIKVLSVTTVESDEPNRKKIAVTVKAQVQKVERTKSGLKPGDDIGISYVHSRYKEPLAGPSEIPVLEQGDVCPAFLARDGEGKTYKPVAGGYSFKAVK